MTRLLVFSLAVGLTLGACGDSAPPPEPAPKAKAKEKAKPKEKAKQKAKAKAEIDPATLTGPIKYGADQKDYDGANGAICCERMPDKPRDGLGEKVYSVGTKEECGKPLFVQANTKAGTEVAWGYCVQYYKADTCCVDKFMGTPKGLVDKKRENCFSGTGSDWYEGTCDNWKIDGGKVKSSGKAKGKAKGKGKGKGKKAN